MLIRNSASSRAVSLAISSPNASVLAPRVPAEFRVSAQNTRRIRRLCSWALTVSFLLTPFQGISLSSSRTAGYAQAPSQFKSLPIAPQQTAHQGIRPQLQLLTAGYMGTGTGMSMGNDVRAGSGVGIQKLPSKPSSPSPSSLLTSGCADGDVFCNKPATANANTSTADNANDGSDSSSWSTSSTYETPWWQVDLQAKRVITRIIILQDALTGDGHGYATTIKIAAFSDNGAEVMMTTTTGLTGGTADITFPNTVAYRYYRVYAWVVDHFTAVFTLYTVEGYLGPQAARPAPMDIFRSRSTNSSNGTTNSPYANDGDDSTSWADRDVGNPIYWNVDLGASTAISWVRIYQHPNISPAGILSGGNISYARQIAVDGCNGTSTFCSDHANYTVLTTTADSLAGGWVTIPVPHATAYRWYQVRPSDLNAGFGSSWAAFTIQGFIGTPDPLEANSSFESKTSCDACQPINTASGNFWHTFNDISIPGRGFPLVLNHTYNARLSSQNGPMGYGWSHSYNWYIAQDANTNYIVHEGNGAITPFNPDYSSPLRVMATLTSTNSTLVLTTTHGLNTFVFKPLDGSTLAGKLDHITDRNGNTTSLTYTSTNGLLKQVTDPAGRTLTFAYSVDTSAGLLQSVYDSSNTLTVTFDYDGNSNLVTATDVGSKQTSFTYESVGGYHRLLTMQYPNAGVVTNVYDAANRVISQTDPMTRTTQFGYHDFGNGTTITTITNPLGLVTAHYYGDYILNQVVQNPGAGANEAVTIRDYAPGITWPSSNTDSNGHIWSNSWDNAGNLLSTTDPLTLTASYVYNATNDLVTVTHTNQLTTTFSYDNNGNLLRVAEPLTETNQTISSTFGYDTVHTGDLLTVTNPLGKNWRMAYDANGYVMSTTNPLAETARFSSDNLGRLTTATSPRVLTTTVAYNNYGQPTIITDTRGYTTTYAYDPMRNLSLLTDTLGYTTTNTYDNDSEVTTVSRPSAGISTTYAYDNAGRVVSTTNALMQTTTYGYDDINRIITSTDPLTRSTSLNYDLAGNTLIMTDAMGLTITLGYDVANQLTNVNYHDSGVTPDVSYGYNSRGLRATMTDGTGTTAYGYDSLNRLTSVQNGAGKTVGYGYDIGSRLTSISYPNPSSAGAMTITHGYDDANRLTAVRDWFTNTTSFAHDPDGNLTTLTYPNGVTTTLGFDNAGQVTTITDSSVITLTSAPFLTFTYSLNKAGIITSTDEGLRGQHDYTYDAAFRLLGDQLNTSPNFSSTWGYDAATQINTTSYRASGVSSLPVTTTRQFDKAGQLLSMVEAYNSQTTKSMAFSFDAKGNRTQQLDSVAAGAPLTTTYGYNQINQLTNFTTFNSGTTPTTPITATYKYDGDGVRMSKVRNANGLTPGGTDNFVWDMGGGLPLLLQDGGSSYIYGPGSMLLEEVGLDTTPATLYRKPVNWTSAVNVTTSADNAATSAITKTGGVAEVWDSGAVSVSPTQTIASGDGYVEATVDSLLSWRMIGLSNGDTDQSNTDIDFAAYMAHNVFKVSEGGVIKTALSNLAAGDKVRVAVENGLVKYYINNTAVYTSTSTPTYPLLVDTSILTAGKKISGVVLCAPCHVYYYHQDRLGSVRALTDSTARVVATYNYDAYGRRNYTNNNGVGAAASAGNIYNQPVSWTNAISVTSAPTLTFNTIQKSAGPDNVWNAGAVSTQQIRGGDGYVEVRHESILTYRKIGLSHGDTDQSDADIDFEAYLRATDFKVFEGGVDKGSKGSLAAGDVVRVAVEGGKVKYYINNTAVYTSTATPTYPLLVDTSISIIGTKLANVYLCTPCLVSEGVAAPAGTTSVSSVYNPFGYAGEYTDAESGLIYLRARYYEPSTQQFLSVDPIVGITGQPYAYALGSPTNITDPSGELAVGVCIGGNGQYYFLGIGVSGCFVVTSSGDMGFQHSFAGQGTTNPAGGSVTTGIQTSLAANKLSDLEGPFGGLGMSVGEGGIVGGDFLFGSTKDGNGCSRFIDEENLQIGLGLGFPVEFHGGISSTYTDGHASWDDMAYAIHAWWGNLTHPGAHPNEWWNPYVTHR